MLSANEVGLLVCDIDECLYELPNFSAWESRPRPRLSETLKANAQDEECLWSVGYEEPAF